MPTTPRRRTPRPIQPTRARAGTAALALALAVLTGCGSGDGDEVRHTVTADDGTFDLGLDGEGSGGSHRFTEPGTHAYHCSVHPSMTGTVLVD